MSTLHRFDYVVSVSGKPCEKPPTLMDGEILQPKRRFAFPDVIKYECNYGFRMAGGDKIECDKNGKWSKLDAQCNGIVLFFIYVFQ